jgi:predicted phosphodiesterase
MGEILLVGDVHGNTNHAMSLLAAARREGCDRLFALGDFGAWEHTPAGVRYFDLVARAARKQGVVVYFLDGNHDKTSLLLELYGDHRDEEGFLVCRDGLRYAPRGHRWTWDGTRFAAFGGAYSVDKEWRLVAEAELAWKAERRRTRFGSSHEPATAGTLWFPEEEMTDEEVDRLLAADPSPIDVLLTHDKPRASKPAWNRKDLPECWPNQDRIQRVVTTLTPRLVVHGHLHHRYTDEISNGTAAPTRVEGLAADPWAAERPGYDKSDSWLVLTLPYRG